MKDFYYILGTTNNATPPEIDAAYQKLARKFRQAGDEQDEFIDARFRDISEAYDTLRDAGRRRKYDLAFKKNQSRYLAAFKLKYLNVAVALTFLVMTALFAIYVIKTLRGHPSKNVVQKPVKQSAPMALTHPKKHHKLIAPAAKKPVAAPDTTPKQPVKTIHAAPPPASVDSTYTATLHANITGIVYLHQAPDYNSPVLAKMPDKAEVRVLQKGAAYYKVRFKGVSGYVIRGAVEGK